MDASEIDRDAELIYNYHRMSMPLTPASAIFCLCSLDTRVARRAAQLFLDGLGASSSSPAGAASSPRTSSPNPRPRSLLTSRWKWASQRIRLSSN